MSDTDDSDINAPSTSKVVKKQKLSYEQKYRDEWEKEFQWIAKNKKGPYFAW